MKRFLIILSVILLLPMRVSAMDITAPEVPESGKTLLPEEPETFGEGLWTLLTEAVSMLEPSLAAASGICLQILAVATLVGITKMIPGSSDTTAELVGVIAVAVAMIRPTGTLINEAVATVDEMCNYGKLLIPVMAAALAAHGGISSSTGLYAGTVVFDAFLGSLISGVIVPAIYIFLCLSVASCAIGEQTIGNIKAFVKWLMTWMLKIVLYIFTGFMGITGVVSGTVDAAALKATKLTISGAVPVVGGILSDASEAVLVSAGILKNAAGVYGLLAVLAVWLGPFLKIAVQYLLLKVTGALSSNLGGKKVSTLVRDFSGAMGLLLGITGTVCLLLMVSVVCFMRGGYT